MRYVEGLTSVEGGVGRTGSRSPMQWSGGVNAGFSSAAAEKLYIVLDPDPDRPTAEKSIGDPDSLYNEVKKLIGIRQMHTALQSKGKISFVYAEENSYPLAYLRSDDNEKILVVVNPADRECGFDFDGLAGETLYLKGSVEVKGGKVTAAAQSAAFIKIK